jgi:hypothetical protein
MNKKFLSRVYSSPHWVWLFLRDHLGHVTGNTLGWIVIVLLHLSSVPTLLSVMAATNDRLPPLDIMIFVWSALVALFFKSLIERNRAYIATISLGFVAQTLLMGVILLR